MASHNQKLEWWGDRICGEGRIDITFMGRSPVRIQPEMLAATEALEAALIDNGYQLPIGVTGSYSCRKISGTDTWSLHAIPIAIDVDYANNPVLPYALERGFGTDPGCTITEAQVNAAEAIVNEHGDSIWKWLGWRTPKADPMHFEIDVRPGDCQPYVKETDVELERYATRWRNPEDFDAAAVKGLITEAEAAYWKTVPTDSPEWQDLRDAVEVRYKLW